VNAIAQQRCFNHRSREAAARCPECGRFFCRECVTEHDDRVVCATCLANIAGKRRKRRVRLGTVKPYLQATGGFVFLWWILYAIGQVLVRIPSAFHEGRMWEELP
jgi:hypothetical protein